MSYRIMYFTGGYSSFLHGLVGGIPDGERTYDRLYKAFTDSQWGGSDYWVRWFREHGHAAEMIVCNFKELQKAWAVEHNVSYDEKNWVQQILLAQVKEWKPDVIWILDIYLISADVRRLIREALPRVVLLGWRFAPTSDVEELRDLDMVITGAGTFADIFRKSGIRTEVIPLYFFENILESVPFSAERLMPFVFCGTVGQVKGWHSRRYRMIEKLLERTSLEVYTGKLGGKSDPPWMESIVRAFPKGMKENLPARLRHRISLQAIYSDRFHRAKFGRGYFYLLGNTQLCFNAHGDIAADFAGNLRMFEATGMGACLLTDWKPNIDEFFEPDREIVAYRSPEEAVEKANYLLSHRKEREAIAKCGQNRVLKDHTMAVRMIQIEMIISHTIKKKVK